MRSWFAGLTILTIGLATGVGAQPDRAADVARAVELQAAGRYARAASLLRPWVDEHPGDSEAALLLGQVLIEEGRAGEALDIWRDLLAAHRGSGPVYRAVIDRLRREGQVDAAIEIMEQAHRDLDDPRPYAWDLTELCLQRDEYDRAARALLAFLAREPRRLALMEGRLLSLAQAERTAGRGGQDRDGNPTPGATTGGLLEALDRAAAAAREETGDEGGHLLAAHVLLGSLALEVGQADRALAAYAVIAPLPEATPLVFQFASRCQAVGRSATAAAAYELVRIHDPDSPYLFQALLRQAQAEESTGHLERATALYRQLADEFPSHPEAIDALLRIGKIGLGQGRVDDARATFEQVLTLDRAGGRRATVRFALAECDIQAGDLEGARDQFEALLTAGDEARPVALYGLLEVALYQGRLDAVTGLGDSLLAHYAAHPLANDALELQLLVDEFGEEGEALAICARALLLERQGRLEEAQTAWQGFAEYGPDELRARSLLRRAQLSGRPHYSLTLYDAVLDRWPKSSHALEAHLGRAVLFERLGDTAAALAEYEGALLAYSASARAPVIRLEIQRLRRLTDEPADRGRTRGGRSR